MVDLKKSPNDSNQEIRNGLSKEGFVQRKIQRLNYADAKDSFKERRFIQRRKIY